MYDGSEMVRTKDRVTLSVKPEPPRPLARELPPADPFPIDALGPLLRDAVQAIHDKLQAPLAIGGQSVLGTATLAVQGHADVQLPTGQTRPVSSFLITIAESGERKSGCDTEALWPIRHREKILREQHDWDLSNYQNEKGAWECARDNATKGVKGDRAAIKLALDKLGPMPTAPLEPILTCTEPTFEGLCKLFAVGHASLGIFATEGGHFIGGHGMSDDNKLRTATGLSAVWDGDAIRRVRAGDGPYILPGRRLAVHLMVQPDVAGILLNDRLLTNQGLLSRFLITAPDSAAGTRLWREPAPTSDAALKRYGARLLEIMEARLPLVEGKANELKPCQLPLSQAARRLWIGFADYIECALAPQGELESIRGLANKLPEHAARLAAVLALVNDIHTSELIAPEMSAGIALAQHYAAEALRLFGMGRLRTDLQLAQKLLVWLLGGWREAAVSLPDIYQRGPNAIRDKATAKKLVTILEDHGRLVRLPGGATVAGQHRREAWRIVRG